MPINHSPNTSSFQETLLSTLSRPLQHPQVSTGGAESVEKPIKERDTLIRLSDVKKGMSIRLTRIEQADVRTQLIRFGLGESSVATCFERIPFGPIILKHGRQEVAIGRDLAKEIWIEVLQTP